MSRLFLVLMLTSLSLKAMDDTGVNGTVKDELGAAIENATVLLLTTSTLSTHTDRLGNFSFNVAADGLYDLFISAIGFAPTCTKLQVSEHHWAIFDPTLKVDQLTVKLHGDTFDTKPHLQRH